MATTPKPPIPVTVAIAQGDVRATLDAVLQEVTDLNDVCSVLVAYRFEHLGTADAQVVLQFDKSKCKKPKA